MSQADSESGILPSAMSLAKTSSFIGSGVSCKERQRILEAFQNLAVPVIQGMQPPELGPIRGEDGFYFFVFFKRFPPTPRVVRSAVPSFGGS